MAPAEVGLTGPSTLGKEAQERREAPTRSARGKERAVWATPPWETDEEMARRLQVQEEEEEEARRGADAATLAVVREAAGPMTQGQVEELEAPLLAVGSSQPFVAEAAQPPVAVAT